MKYRYYLPEDGETIEDAREVTRRRFSLATRDFVLDDDFEDDEDAAAAAAEKHFDESSGDWDGVYRFAIVDAHDRETLYDVEPEYVPRFMITEVSAGGATGP